MQKDLFRIAKKDSCWSMSENWTYSYEPESKQQSTAWVFEDESNPTKVTRALSRKGSLVSSVVVKKFYAVGLR